MPSFNWQLKDNVMAAIVILPGIGGSDEMHWQTVWQKSNSSMIRFHPRDWDKPDLNDWIGALDRAIEKTAEAPILVAHSLACLLVAHWAARGADRPVAGAFLVAVPDPDGPAFPVVEAASFRAVPAGSLTFPALIVASDNDPYGSIDYVRRRAATWGAGLVVAGALGHISSASNLGNWPLGAMLLEAFKSGAKRR
jgi:uncharacterized protein